MGARAARKQQGIRQPRRSTSMSSSSTLSVRSMLGVSSMDGALMDASFEDEEAVNETLAQVTGTTAHAVAGDGDHRGRPPVTCA
jgi:hypothetical protein